MEGIDIAILKKVTDICFVIFGILCIIFFIMGPIYNVVHPGSLLMLLTGILFLFCGIIIKKLNTNSFLKFIYIVSVIWMIFVSVFVTVNFLGGLTNLPDNRNDSTVIVLGARIKNGYVNLVQKRRLDMAVEYLEENPAASCIVTGGLQEDENLVVGNVMRDYLTNKGVDKSRIFVEGQAQDTYENLLYSKDIIDEQGLSENIVIVSDNFHLLRSKWFANSIGFTNVYKLASSTPLGILPSYWFREILSMLKGFVITAFPNLFGH